MKTLFGLAVSLLLSAQAISQPLTVGDKVPDLTLDNCIMPGSPNMIVKNVSLKDFVNKFVILDFWATWCGPCIASMPKYEGIQKKYSDQVQVIGITHETVKRIQTFVRNRQISFILAVDTASTLRKYFPYHNIPHVVIIDKTGTIKAITYSENVTDEVMNDLINGREVSLPFKKDKVDFDFEKSDYFNAASNTRESFNIQGSIPGLGSMSLIGKGIFANRRISMFNFTIDALYRMAYRVSYLRTALEVDRKQFEYREEKNKYCVDVIVANEGDGLYAFMQEQLPKHFDIKARWEKKKMPVTVLRRTDGPLVLESSADQNEHFSGSGNHFNGIGVKISAFADYLENLGITNMPVVDETNISNRYTIQFEWQSEKKGHMEEVLRNTGLELAKEEREIDVLVLYK